MDLTQSWGFEIGRTVRTAGVGAIAGALACIAVASAGEPVVPPETDPPALPSMITDRDGALRNLDRQKRGVIRVSIPTDVLRFLSDKATSSRRKVTFIHATLPLLLHANALIMRNRMWIEILQIYQTAGIALSADDASWLARIVKHYGLGPVDGPDNVDFEALLARVDIVPPSLALAQAAEESGWGTSRFALKGKALFGQRIFRGADGIVPLERPEGETYRVKTFDHVFDGVRAYLHNLNTHYAYESFRHRRGVMRREQGTLDGYGLTTTLLNYSERRDSYLRSIRAIMRHNGLGVLDRLQPKTDRVGRPDT